MKMKIVHTRNLGWILALAACASLALTLPASAAPKKKEKAPDKEPAAVSDEKMASEEGDAEEGEPEKAASPVVDDSRKTALISRMTLKVVNPEDARVALSEKVKELGGFPILVTDTSIEVKVPPGALSPMLAYAAEQGLVVEKSLERQDLTQEIAQLEGQLKSKRDILKKLRSFFDDSNVQATLRIEQTMTSLVNEMEEVKGRLRVLGERSTWARIDVSFQFKQRDRIIYVNSPFEWLNTVNLDRFLEEF